MAKCEHDIKSRVAIPEHSLYEYWVCYDCGEVIELCKDSPYPRKSDLRAQGLLPTITKGKQNVRN